MSSDLTISYDPILVIQNNTYSKDINQIQDFIKIIAKMYQYELFKPFLDLTATLALEGRLRFSISPQKLFQLDEGSCRSFEEGVFNKFLGKFTSRKKYDISIRKNSPEVIIHEIGHMIEKESNSKLEDGFEDSFIKDLKEGDFSNRTLRSTVDQVMNKDLKRYPPTQAVSEIFARYFQLLAMSRDVSSRSSSNSYSFLDVYQALPNTRKWIEKKAFPAVYALSNRSIINFSKRYTKALGDIEHHWSEEKVKPIHTKSENKQWSKTIQSIKYDEF